MANFIFALIKRTGNVWTSAAHIVTAVIGSGVLSLSWSFAQMGWIAGPIILLAFAWCTYFTSRLLADCYRSPDPITGKRNYIYMDAVKANLGEKLLTSHLAIRSFLSNWCKWLFSLDRHLGEYTLGNFLFGEVFYLNLAGPVNGWRFCLKIVDNKVSTTESLHNAWLCLVFMYAIKDLDSWIFFLKLD